MFYHREMVASREQIDHWHSVASRRIGRVPTIPRRTPIGQMVKSLISSRTRDAVSLAAFHRLKARFGSSAGIAAAEPPAVEAVIAPVTFPDVKAARLVETLRRIGAEHPDFRLDHVAGLPIAEALADLERLPGVGRKTAASVLNFSTLRRPVFVVDTHVARVLGRLGVAGDAVRISAIVTAEMTDWEADRFVEFHAQLKRLGQSICRWDVPRCDACPFASCCATAR